MWEGGCEQRHVAAQDQGRVRVGLKASVGRESRERSPPCCEECARDEQGLNPPFRWLATRGLRSKRILHSPFVTPVRLGYLEQSLGIKIKAFAHLLASSHRLSAAS
jgi:hypothetical protein